MSRKSFKTKARFSLFKRKSDGKKEDFDDERSEDRTSFSSHSFDLQHMKSNPHGNDNNREAYLYSEVKKWENKQFNDMMQRIMVNEIEGYRLLKLQDNEGALKFLSRSLALRNEFNEGLKANSIELAKLYSTLGKLKAEMNRFVEAHSNLRKGITMYERMQRSKKKNKKDIVDSNELSKLLELEIFVRNVLIADGSIENNGSFRRFVEQRNNQSTTRNTTLSSHSNQTKKIKPEYENQIQSCAGTHNLPTSIRNNCRNDRVKVDTAWNDNHSPVYKTQLSECSRGQQSSNPLVNSMRKNCFGNETPTLDSRNDYDNSTNSIPACQADLPEYFRDQQNDKQRYVYQSRNLKSDNRFQKPFAKLNEYNQGHQIDQGKYEYQSRNFKSNDRFQSSVVDIDYENTNTISSNHDILSTIGEEGDEKQISTRLDLAKVDLKLGLVKKAQTRLLLALDCVNFEEFEDEGMNTLLGQIYELLGDIECDYNEDYTSARIHYKKALNIFEEEKVVHDEQYDQVYMKILGIAGLT